MQRGRTTFSKFIIEDQHRRTNPDANLTGLLNDIQTACKFIAFAISRGALDDARSIDAIANGIIERECEGGGKLCGMISKDAGKIHVLAAQQRGRYLLIVDPIDGSPNADINVTVGTIFAVLRARDELADPTADDFLQPGTEQVAAGFALYGPTSMIVLSLGEGVNGFTLDREIGAYELSHPHMRIPEETCEFAINGSNERFWEPPVRHYVEECIEGRSGLRGVDFQMRWVDSLVAEVYRVLVRGGIFICPRETTDLGKHGTLSLLYEANPIAAIVEEAGGAASTGRERILDIVPASLDQRVPVILGSRREVERLTRFHEMYDRGEELVFETPLFNTRSLFRTI
ncbi:MAG: class 1 fructose-bisphosphatase [Vulcanimicrobiaceae bacterium]